MSQQQPTKRQGDNLDQINEHSTSTSPGPPANFWKVVFGCAVGSFFEYYDYTLISYFADEISSAYFPPNDSEETTLLEAFALNGIGYFVRPFGGLFFGWLSDTRGRRFALIAALFCMGFPTVIFGCLPDYNTIGYASTVLVFALRILQGLAVSGEYTNAIIYIWEQCGNEHNYAFAQGLLWCGSTGSLMSALWKIIITNSMSKSERYSWGWRIPFWGGIIVFLIGYCIRVRLPKDEIEDRLNNPTISVFKHIKTYYRPFSILTIALLIPGVAHNAAFSWLPTYLYDLHDPTDSFAYYGSILSMVFGLSYMVFMGYIADKYDRHRKRIRISIIMDLFMLFAAPLMLLIIARTYNSVLLTFEQILFAMICTGCIPSTMAWSVGYIEDRNIRSTILNLPYNIAAAVGAGLTSSALTAMVSVNDVWGGALAGIYIGIIATLSAFALLLGTKYAYVHDDLYDYDPIKDKNKENPNKSTNKNIDNGAGSITETGNENNGNLLSQNVSV